MQGSRFVLYGWVDLYCMVEWKLMHGDVLDIFLINSVFFVSGTAFADTTLSHCLPCGGVQPRKYLLLRNLSCLDFSRDLNSAYIDQNVFFRTVMRSTVISLRWRWVYVSGVPCHRGGRYVCEVWYCESIFSRHFVASYFPHLMCKTSIIFFSSSEIFPAEIPNAAVLRLNEKTAAVAFLFPTCFLRIWWSVSSCLVYVAHLFRIARKQRCYVEFRCLLSRQGEDAPPPDTSPMEETPTKQVPGKLSLPQFAGVIQDVSR